MHFSLRAVARSRVYTVLIKTDCRARLARWRWCAVLVDINGCMHGLVIHTADIRWINVLAYKANGCWNTTIYNSMFKYGASYVHPAYLLGDMTMALSRHFIARCRRPSLR